MTQANRYIRDMRGYGADKPDPKWPGGERICVQIVVNYEEGGENCLLHGDAASEAFLSEIPGAAPWPGMRHWNMESVYEYGARAGFWRVHRLLTEMEIPATVYGVATALARSPEPVAAMKAAGWEIASHGLKWVDHRDMPPEEEARQIREAIRLHAEVVGEPPRGWYTGRTSINTVRLTAAHGFDYISDAYDDDLPYWLEHDGHGAAIPPQLVIPYTLDANDMRFATPQGFNSGDQFFAYLRDGFDTLYAEGVEGRGAMMSVGLHCRLIGRPGRLAALTRFLEYARGHEGVWFATRAEIARHWRAVHPHGGAQIRPSRMTRAEFLARFGGLFAAPWVAERAYALELGPAHDSPVGLTSAFLRVLRSASEADRAAALAPGEDLRRLEAELPARLKPIFA